MAREEAECDWLGERLLDAQESAAAGEEAAGALRRRMHDELVQFGRGVEELRREEGSQKRLLLDGLQQSHLEQEARLCESMIEEEHAALQELQRREGVRVAALLREQEEERARLRQAMAEEAQAVQQDAQEVLTHGGCSR